MKIFRKFNETDVEVLFRERYNLKCTILEITPKPISPDLLLLVEELLKNRAIFETSKKFIKISSDNLYAYLEIQAKARGVLLKSKLSYYDPELVFAGLLKLKIDTREYYVAK